MIKIYDARQILQTRVTSFKFDRCHATHTTYTAYTTYMTYCITYHTHITHTHHTHTHHTCPHGTTTPRGPTGHASPLLHGSAMATAAPTPWAHLETARDTMDIHGLFINVQIQSTGIQMCIIGIHTTIINCPNTINCILCINIYSYSWCLDVLCVECCIARSCCTERIT